MTDAERTLPPWRSVLAVVAHPDDESFGLGAVIDSLVRGGAAVSVLCMTQGEASTLHGVEGDLAALRGRELADAADELGMHAVRLLDHPDGGLAAVDLSTLSGEVAEFAAEVGADGLLVFDDTGITGHSDHIRATEAAVHSAATLGIGVLAWTLPEEVADRLADEFGAGFRGRPEDGIDIVLDVDRTRQRVAVDCHPSQAVPGSALWRRLDLQGDRECLRWLTPSA